VRFFIESHRILKSGGTLRVAVPSADRILVLAEERYLNWHKHSGFGDGTKIKAVKSILLDHGHLSAWNHPILRACLFAAGFDIDWIKESSVGQLEGHGIVIGEHNNDIETIVMEAVK
jgi:hypothetical protein